MDKNLDINNLFSGMKTKSSKDISSSLLNKAAILLDFDILEDFKNASESERSALKEITVKKINGLRTLKKPKLEGILNDLGAKGKLLETIRQLGLDERGFGEFILKFHRKEIDLIDLGEQEVYFLSKYLEIFPDEELSNKLKLFLERNQFYSFFESVTSHFAGREKEIRRLTNYVDWLPKENVVSRIRQTINETFGDGGKHPLLIKGVGGVGKTTLIARFILLHSRKNKHGRHLPFIYIDYDLPGFSIQEPVDLLFECGRQLKLQFPSFENFIIEIESELAYWYDASRSIEKEGSNNRERSYLLDRINEKLLSIGLSLEDFSRPVLMVLDSFEEMQYKATSNELTEFFSFVNELIERFPRLRVVYAGRADITDENKELSFNLLEINSFDESSTIALFKEWGIKDDKIAKLVYKKLGGNPLILKLAETAYKKDQSILESKELQNSTKIQEYLVVRILGHIRDKRAKKIAVPGMLLRRVNADTIEHILAETCDLNTPVQKIDTHEANKILEVLKKEVFLIKDSGMGEFIFRQDLRKECLPMIKASLPERSIEIHRKAIDFYRDKEDNISKGEYFYHKLMLGEKPKELLNESVFKSIRSFIDSNVNELPEASQIFVRQLQKARVQSKTIENSDFKNRVDYYSNRIKEALDGSDLELFSLDKEIVLNNEASSPELKFYYDYMQYRLYRFRKILFFKYTYTSNPDFYDSPISRIEFIFLESRVYESLRDYETAWHVISKNSNYWRELNLDIQEERFLKAKVLLHSLKLFARLKVSLQVDKQDVKSEWRKIIQYLELQNQVLTSNLVYNKMWNYIFLNIKLIDFTSFFDSMTFKRRLTFIHEANNQLLEELSKGYLGISLYDIMPTGSSKILKQDLALVWEITSPQINKLMKVLESKKIPVPILMEASLDTNIVENYRITNVGKKHRSILSKSMGKLIFDHILDEDDGTFMYLLYRALLKNNHLRIADFLVGEIENIYNSIESN
ncbi:NACHT domain-containing protein [Ulvibacterium sp.]|uniref:NACHT domain-containing protein n=1 Tax=Ulvibacterium sp. TaxID=2665914 RepID=UPI003CC51AF3